MQKTIYYNFEGFDFELIVDYHANTAGIFIVGIEPTNMVRQKVCKQDFYHILSVLRYDIVNGRQVDKIKQKLISDLNLDDKVEFKNKTRNFIFLVSVQVIALILLAYFILREV